MLLVAQRDGVAGGGVNSLRAALAEIFRAPRRGDAVHVHARAVEMQGQVIHALLANEIDDVL
eukprot:2340306-Pyramimonas_sp.AAC.1